MSFFLVVQNIKVYNNDILDSVEHGMWVEQ